MSSTLAGSFKNSTPVSFKRFYVCTRDLWHINTYVLKKNILYRNFTIEIFYHMVFYFVLNADSLYKACPWLCIDSGSVRYERHQVIVLHTHNNNNIKNCIKKFIYYYTLSE